MKEIDMKSLLKFVVFLAALVCVVPAASAFQQQNGFTSLNKNGTSETTTQGLNIAAFPVKDVTMAAYQKIGIVQSRVVLGLFLHDISQYGGIPDSTVQRWGREGLSSCMGKLGGRHYIVTMGGNATKQTHIVTLSSPMQGLVSPTNVQNYQRCSQVDLTTLFCNVYEYEFVAQAAQIHAGYVGGYLPLCYLTQGNFCGLSSVKKAEANGAQEHPLIPPMPDILK
jgi:hypothetical protein